jgi:hypothetical protein
MYYSLLGHVAFWVLIIWGWAADGLTLATRLTFLALWLAGYVAFPHLLRHGEWWFAPYVAVLDIVMVLIVLKDNVRLS